MRVALIGLGAIGSRLVELVDADPDTPIRLVGALVRDSSQKRNVDFPTFERLEDMFLATCPDVVAEAAGHTALREHGPACLLASVPLVFLSVGALADPLFEEELSRAAAVGGVQATAASGGIGALDVIAAASQDGLESVVHTIVKPPAALGVETAVYREVFRGPAREAARQFPQNANVAAAVSLAGLGLDRTTVVIAADPAATTNRHLVDVRGTFGEVSFRIDSKPSPRNPKTAAIVGASLKRALERFSIPIVVG